MAVIMDDYPARYDYGPPPQYSRYSRHGPPPGPYSSHPMGFFAPAPPLYPPAWDSSRPRHGRVTKPHGQGRKHNPQSRYQHAPPDLPQLFAANKRKMKRYHGKDRSTPRSVPPAPLNDNLYLASTVGSQTPALPGAEFHNVTPNPHGSVWKNSTTMDRELLELAKGHGIDIFGDGGDEALADVGLAPREFPDDEEAFPDDDDGDGGTDVDTASTVNKLRRQLQEANRYIADLEDRNRDLDDKVYLLQQELGELKASLQGGVDVQHDGQPPSSPSQHSHPMEEATGEEATGQQADRQQQADEEEEQAVTQQETQHSPRSPRGEVER